MKARVSVAYGIAAMLVLMMPTAQAVSAQTRKLSSADQHFLTEAIQGDLSEIKMGELAQQKGQTEAAKQFGQMLQQDHSQNLDKAKDLAQQSGMAAPNEPNTEQQAMYDRMSKLSGARFDEQFARAMVKDHKEDISKFRKEAKSNGPLASFAQQTLPTLQKHLQAAENLTSKQSSHR